MALKIFRGIFGPRLPRKLRKPETANAWGMRFSDRWVDTHENLAGRYSMMDKQIPEITSHYIKRKIELGNKLATLRGKG